jgi:hypothetical protein
VLPPPRSATTETFAQGPSDQAAGYTGDLMASDFGTYLFNSMTPEQQQAYIAKGLAEQKANPIAQQAPQRAYEQSGGDTAYLTPEQRILKQNRDLINNTSQQNDEALQRLEELSKGTNQNNQAALDQMNNLINAQDPRNAAYIDMLRGEAGKLDAARGTANQGSLDALGSYTNTLNDLSARNDATIGRAQGMYDQLATPLESQLALNPEAWAAQQQALSQLQGTANGALDYQSQAAGAYADPRYVAMRDQGLADLYDVSKGSKDVHVGQEDPKAYAAAMEALDKASALTNPAVTDAENFLYEKARQGWEMDQRALDGAKMSNLRRRGMAGGGAELTLGALGSQQIAQQRVLSDLAASAQAVARSQDMLRLQGQLGTQLNSEANALATGNANRQLQALGMYEQGAETAQQSSFDQAYKRGVAADTASANNQQTRLSGQIASGNQANAMQDDAYNVDSFNELFRQRERDALWGRTTDLSGLELNASAQNSNNASNIFNGTTSVLNQNYLRDAEGVRTNMAVGGVGNGLENDQLNRRLGVQGAQINTNNTNQAQQNLLAGMGTDNSRWTTNQLLGNNQVEIAGVAAQKAALDSALAANSAQHRADSTGIFGLPIIGSRNGLLGGFGIGQNSEEEDAAAIRKRYGG